jgi:hypothetical protein
VDEYNFIRKSYSQERQSMVVLPPLKESVEIKTRDKSASVKETRWTPYGTPAKIRVKARE